MLDIKQAYDIIGVSEGANKDQIIRRYDVLLKKLRVEKQDGLSQAEYDRRMAELTEAYNLLMGYDTSDLGKEFQFRENRLLKKMGINEKKLRNFLHYYKFIILFGLITALIVGYTIKTIVTRVEPDFNIAYIGNIYCPDSEDFKAKIRAGFPGIKEPGIDGAYISGEDDPNLPMMQSKIMIILGAADTDIVVLDKANFDRLARQGAFESLEAVADELDVDMEANKDYVVESEAEPGKEQLFGVDISDSVLFGPPELLGEEKIAAISVRTKNRDKAIELLKQLLRESEQQET